MYVVYIEVHARFIPEALAYLDKVLIFPYL